MTQPGLHVTQAEKARVKPTDQVNATHERDADKAIRLALAALDDARASLSNALDSETRARLFTNIALEYRLLFDTLQKHNWR